MATIVWRRVALRSGGRLTILSRFYIHVHIYSSGLSTSAWNHHNETRRLVTMVPRIHTYLWPNVWTLKHAQPASRSILTVMYFATPQVTKIIQIFAIFQYFEYRCGLDRPVCWKSRAGFRIEWIVVGFGSVRMFCRSVEILRYRTMCRATLRVLHV